MWFIVINLGEGEGVGAKLNRLRLETKHELMIWSLRLENAVKNDQKETPQYIVLSEDVTTGMTLQACWKIKNKVTSICKIVNGFVKSMDSMDGSQWIRFIQKSNVFTCMNRDNGLDILTLWLSFLQAAHPTHLSTHCHPEHPVALYLSPLFTTSMYICTNDPASRPISLSAVHSCVFSHLLCPFCRSSHPPPNMYK